jgi:hypothetical protein
LGFALADYQAAVDALAAKQAEVNVLHAQYPVLYHEVDDNSDPVGALNQGSHSTLKGLLQGKPQAALLDQIDIS